MIVDLLEDYYRAEANQFNGRPRNVFRASSAGYCERRLGYEKLGIRGDPIQPRRAAVFRHGHLIDQALKADLALVLGDRFLNLDKLPQNECMIDGIRVTFLPDGAFQLDNGDIGIIEIKTMSDRSFEKAKKGEIDKSYLAQAWVYHYGTSFNPIVFVAYRKETSHFCEVVFDRNARDIIVTERLGGNKTELFLNEPLLVTEVRTPFDPTIEQAVKAKFKRLKILEEQKDLAPPITENDNGDPAIFDEEDKIHGKANAMEHAHNNGYRFEDATVSNKGGWYTFKTGRKILNFPCSYCQWVRLCRNPELELSREKKPIWVVP